MMAQKWSMRWSEALNLRKVNDPSNTQRLHSAALRLRLIANRIRYQKVFFGKARNLISPSNAAMLQ